MYVSTLGPASRLGLMYGSTLGSASMLGPNRVIAKNVKGFTYNCNVTCVTLIVREGEMPWPRAHIITLHSHDLQTKSCNQWVGCLLGSVERINDLWDGFLDTRKVRGLVPCCGQDSYRVQVPQHPIDSYRYISHIQVTVGFSLNVLLKKIS